MPVIAAPAASGHPAAASPPSPAAAHPPPPGAPVILRILNDSGLHNYANIVLDWELRANGLVRQKGSLSNLPIPPKHPATVRLPVRISSAQPPSNAGASATDQELVLGLHYHYRNKPVLAEEQFLLKPWSGSQGSVHPTGELSFTDENGIFTIQSPGVLISFDKQTGWLQQYTIKDNPLLGDTPGCKTLFWLEPADPGYSAASAAGSGTWKEASQAPHLQLFSTSTGSQLVIVRAEYTLPETACLLHLSYTINATGEMEVEQSMEADSSRQGEPLPFFGMYWVLPPGFDTVTAYGSLPVSPQADLSVSSHPPIPQIYHSPVAPPRETNRYTGIRWWAITRPDGKGLRLTADSTLLTISTASTGARLRLDIGIPGPPDHRPYGNYKYAFKVTPLPPEEKPGAHK